MDFVVEEDLKAHLTCWYIQKYVKENPHPQYFEHIYQWPHWLQQRRRERLPGDRLCVAACFGHAGRDTIKDLPGTVEPDKMNPEMTDFMTKTSLGSTLGQQVSSVCNSVTLARSRKLIRRSSFVKTSNSTNQSWSLLPQTETSRMCTHHRFDTRFRFALQTDMRPKFSACSPDEARHPVC